jgi:hypothetical protein
MRASVEVDLVLEQLRQSRGSGAEAVLRNHLVPAAHALTEDGDDETTEWTGSAKVAGRKMVSGHRARTAQFVEVGSETVLLEIVGQAPDRFKFRQGLKPERLRFLLRMERYGIHVLLAFYHGFWEAAWLETLPEPDVILHAADGEEGRVGWYAGDDPDRGSVFWISDELNLDSLPPRELPYESNAAQIRLTDGLS